MYNSTERFVTLTAFAENELRGISRTTVFDRAREGCFPVIRKKQPWGVDLTDPAIVAILEKWHSTVSYAEAALAARIKLGTVDNWITKGWFERVEVLGLARISKDSLERCKGKDRIVTEADIVFPDAKGFGRYSVEKRRELVQIGLRKAREENKLGHRWNSEEAEEINRKRWSTHLISAGDAAQILRLPIYQALPVLHRHAKRKIVDNRPMFLKKSVEEVAWLYSELLMKIRTGVQKS